MLTEKRCCLVIGKATSLKEPFIVRQKSQRNLGSHNFIKNRRMKAKLLLKLDLCIYKWWNENGTDKDLQCRIDNWCFGSVVPIYQWNLIGRKLEKESGPKWKDFLRDFPYCNRFRAQIREGCLSNQEFPVFVVLCCSCTLSSESKQ
jgi:hypothetical protein